MKIPFASIISFSDPSVNFSLQFENYIQQNLEQEMYNLMQSFIDASISGLSSNYDISVNSIPLNDISGLSSIFIPNDVSNNAPNDVSNNAPNDVSNNDSDDEIEGDLSVE